MPGIFINYRRGDQSAFAGRLSDRLAQEFPHHSIFMDVDAISPGADFAEVLDRQIRNCDVLLALIGEGWLQATDSDGRRRIEKDDDFVRLEISAALRRNKLVIPVLLDSAPMPREDELPPSLRPLARRHAARLTHERFRSDCEALVQVLKGAVKQSDTEVVRRPTLSPWYSSLAGPAGRARSGLRDNWRAAAAVSMAIVLAAAGYVFFRQTGPGPVAPITVAVAPETRSEPVPPARPAVDPVKPRADNNSALTFVASGNAYYAKGDYDRAIQDYDQALRLDPALAIALGNRGAIYSYKNQYERALQDLNRAIELDPNISNAFNSRGAVYYDKRQYDRAVQDFDRAIRLDPKNAQAFNNRGKAYEGNGLHDRAIQDFDQAIRLNPDYASAFNGRGRAYVAKGQPDRAIVDLNRAIALNPTLADAYFNRADAFFNKSQLDRAIQDYDQAIRLDPGRAPPFCNRGRAYAEKGQSDRAIRDYDQAISLDQAFAEPYFLRGKAKRLKGDIRGGDADIALAKALQANIIDAMARLGVHP